MVWLIEDTELSKENPEPGSPFSGCAGLQNAGHEMPLTLERSSLGGAGWGGGSRPTNALRGFQFSVNTSEGMERLMDYSAGEWIFPSNYGYSTEEIICCGNIPH